MRANNNLNKCLLAIVRILHTWCIFCLHATCPFSSYLRSHVTIKLQRARHFKANNSLRPAHDDLLHGGRLGKLGAPQPCATHVTHTQEMKESSVIQRPSHAKTHNSDKKNRKKTHKWRKRGFPSE
jgi:hypothetical protein